MNKIGNMWQNRKVVVVLAIVELILLLFLLPGLWKKGEASSVFEGAVDSVTEIAIPVQETGVFHLSVKYKATEGTTSAVSVINGNNIYKGTYSNTMLLSGNEQVQGTTVWLTEASDALSLQISPAENAKLSIETLEIVSTNQGTVIAVVGLLIVSILLDAGCIYLYHIRGKEEEKDCKRMMAAIIGLVVFVSLPLLTDYCLQGNELNLHLRRIEEMKEGLLLGKFLNIYLLFPALLRLTGFPVQTAYRLTLLLLNLVAVVIAYGCFKGMLHDRKIGLIGSMLYVCMPYRLDALYIKADYGESVAICFLPVVFYGFYLLLTEKNECKKCKYIWILPVIALSGMLQADITAFEMALIMVVLLCLLCWRRLFTKSCIRTLCKMAGAFLVLNIWMAAPLFEYLFVNKMWAQHVGSASVQQAGVYWLHYFTTFFVNGDLRTYSDSGIQNAAPLGIGFVLMGLFLLFMWICFVGKYLKQRKEDSNWRFSYKAAIAGVLLVFMSTRYFPWDFLRGRSRIIQVLTADLKSPAELMPAVAMCFIFLGSTIIWQVLKEEKNIVKVYLLAAVLGVTLLTTQFLTGDIIRSRNAERIYAGEYLENVEIPDIGYIFPETGNVKLAEMTDNKGWHLILSDVVSVVGWLALSGTAFVIYMNRRRKEDDYVEEI